MNERIRELAEQADAYAWEQIDEGANFDEQPRYFAEKFAELIVRECGNVAFDHWYKTNQNKYQNSAKLTILKHFGVE